MSRFLWIVSFALAAGIMVFDYVSSLILIVVAMGFGSPGSSALPVLLAFLLKGATYGLGILWFARWLVKEIERRSAEAEIED